MTGWDQARQVYRALGIFGPMTKRDLARLLERPYGSVDTVLAGMDYHGFRLAEDDRKRLYQWRCGNDGYWNRCTDFPIDNGGLRVGRLHVIEFD